MTKIITIITPSYNQGKFIRETINSVLFQKGNFYLDYIIQDGGSTDNTTKIIKEIQEKLKHSCKTKKINQITYFVNKKHRIINCKGVSFRWESKKDKGQTQAINTGLEKAYGEILGYLNSDDTLAKNSLQYVSNYFSKHSDCLILYGLGKLIDINNKDIGDYHNALVDFNKLHSSCDISQPSTFWRKKLITKIGNFNTKYDYAMDYEYWIRASKVCDIKKLNKYLSYTRIHDDTKTNSQSKKIYKNIFQINLEHYKKVHPKWILLYSKLILQNTTTDKWIQKIIYELRLVFLINIYTIYYNHSLPSSDQTNYIYKSILNKILITPLNIIIKR